MSNVIYTRFGTNKGTKRLWLEGTRLASQGITPGIRFVLHLEKGKAVLKFDPVLGERVVSRRSRNGKELPVIDIQAKALEEAFGLAERLRVVIHPDSIEVTIHHQELTEHERLQRLIGKLERGEALDVGSMAHGGGILDHAIHSGLKHAGIESRLAFAVEIEKAYLDQSQEHNPIWDERSIAIEAPMEEVEASKLPRIDALLAGLPCTGASLSGRAKNGLKIAEQHETAGNLFYAFLQVVQATRPSIVLLENVPPYRNTASYTVITSVLEQMGYFIHDTILDGHAMGALENRQRLCMVAMTRGLEGLNLDNLQPIRQREGSINEILESVADDSDHWKSFEYLNAKEARDKEAGKGFRRQILDGTEGSCGTIGRGYKKCRSTEPFVSKPDGSGLQRLFTPVEHARLKTIPETLIEGLSDTTAHEILGQSIVHCAFEAVGRLIGNVLSETTQKSALAA